MKIKKVFITGSSGFIARNFIEMFKKKYRIVDTRHNELDLLNTEAVEKFFKKLGPFDFVIHTAIVGGNRKIPNTPEIGIANLRIFFNIVRNQKYFSKMINLGSGIEYGKERPLVKIAEVDFDKYVPEDNFGLYKYICAKYIENSKKIINIRSFGVWGSYEDPTIRFISNSLCKYILRMPITLNQNAKFDYLYVNDLVNILDMFLSKRFKFNDYNVVNGYSIDLLTIANKINALSEYKCKILVKKRGFANEYSASNSRLLKEIGGFKFTNFDKALAELYRWYLKRRPLLKKGDFVNDHFK